VSTQAAPINFSKISEETIDRYATGLSQLHQRLHHQWREPSFWRWCYLENPAGSGTTIAVRGDLVIGKLGNLYSKLHVDGRTVRASLLEGLEVLPEERSWQCFRGILAGCLEASEKDRIGFGYALATNSTSTLNQQLGWSTLGRVPVYAAITCCAQMAADRSVPSFLAWLGRFADPFLRVNPKKYRDRFQGFEFRRIERFDSQFDDIWHSVKEFRRLAVIKDSQYLNWRYLGCPGRNHESWALYQGNQLQGWVVFRSRQRHREGCLLDLVARDNDPEMILRLTQWTLQRFVASRVGLVRASFPASSLEGEILRKIGFHTWTTRIAGIELVVTGTSEIRKETSFEKTMENWHLSLGDWLYY